MIDFIYTAAVLFLFGLFYIFCADFIFSTCAVSPAR